VLLLVAAISTGWADNALEEAESLRYEAPESALSKLDGAIQEAEAGEVPEKLAELYNLRAEIARDLGRLDQALADAERFQELAESMEDPVLAGEALHIRGTIRAEQGDVAAALEHFHEARRKLEGTGAKGELARVTMAIGIAHSFVDDYARSKPYYEDALELAREAGDKQLEARLLGNLAIVAVELDGPESGLALHREALALSRELDDTRGIAYQLANICDRLVELGRLDEADDTCLRAVDRLEPLGHARVLAGARMTLGDLRREQARPGEALVHYQEALRIAEGEVPVVEREVLGKLAELHEQRGAHAEALDYHKRLLALREEMFDAERSEQIEELEARYRLEQHEKEIELLELNSELQAARLEQRNWILAGVTVAFFMASLASLMAWRGYRIKSRLEAKLAGRNRELEEALATISQLARQDPLTGLLNRRAFLDLADHEQTRARRSGAPVTVAMADIDNFKPINDEHGHAVGDEILKEVAARLREHVREEDVICRWGGEEFVCLLPDTDLEAGRRVVERMRRELTGKPVETGVGNFPIKLTIGMAPLEKNLDAAIEAADRAMYEGKRAGRDRVVVFNHET
jgi:diguanylate cyclase (GGDEF)-like protein